MPSLTPNPNAKLEQLLHVAKQGRLAHEREAWLNLAFYLGQQYTEWHADRGQPGYLRVIPREKGAENQPRPVINKIMHFVRTAHADVLQDRPTGDVLPPTSDYSDRSDSAVAGAWIEDQSDALKTDYDSKLSRAAHWALVAGNGYLKWVWDAENDCPVICSPSFFEVYLDPYAKMFSDCRYIIQSQFMDTEQVYEMYGKEVKTSTSADEVKTELLRGMGSSPVINGVVINELWMKPCRRYPEGQYAVWTGREELVPSQKLPYPHLIANRMLPYTVLGTIERPDSPYYLSPVQFLRPPQMELNVYHAQRLTNRKGFANGKWFIPEELQLDQDPDDSPAQILRGHSTIPGLKPEYIQPLQFTSNDDEMLERGMMHVVGQGEVSLGQAPGRVEAAKALEMLKEADAGALSVLRNTIKVSNDIGWFQQLQNARAFQKADHMVTSYSKEGLPEVKHFKAGDMKPGHRIRTTMTTGLARSRSNKQDLLIRLWDSKVITDPEAMADMMEMPLPSTIQHAADDIMLARNENLTLAEGKAIVPNSWDEHAVHLREHNSYRKSSDFLGLSADAKQRFEHHCASHQALEEIQLGRQAKLQMIIQGAAAQAAPSPAGGPPAAAPPQEA